MNAGIEGQALTISQCADCLRCSESQVTKLIHSKRLRAVNISTGNQRACWRISASALEDFLNGGQPAPGKPKRQPLRKPKDIRTFV